MDKYCIDTSSLIEMKDKYPRDIFRGVWQNIEKLCKDRRIISPIEVLKEIEQVDDELKKWARKMKKIFIKPNEEQSEKLKEILKSYPSLAKFEKEGPNADPWIIALAIQKAVEAQKILFSDEYIVVTEESKNKPNKIPSVCRNYGIECITLIELFRKEGWKF
ncbi:MAG: DUF4411 family protein [bacterium JZ-2024 1]